MVKYSDLYANEQILYHKKPAFLVRIFLMESHAWFKCLARFAGNAAIQVASTKKLLDLGVGRCILILRLPVIAVIIVHAGIVLPMAAITRTNEGD
jgi:hypothetical protein